MYLLASVAVPVKQWMSTGGSWSWNWDRISTTSLCASLSWTNSGFCTLQASSTWRERGREREEGRVIRHNRPKLYLAHSCYHNYIHIMFNEHRVVQIID